jgi:YHS domain-containing protein
LDVVAVDPVCGMEVDEDHAEYETMYRGKKYYFCSAVCEEEFSRDPESYIFADPDIFDEDDLDYADDDV